MPLLYPEIFYLKSLKYFSLNKFIWFAKNTIDVPKGSEESSYVSFMKATKGISNVFFKGYEPKVMIAS